MSELLLNRFLKAFKDEILPLTFEGVNSGNKIFGAAIINKNDHSLKHVLIKVRKALLMDF